MKREKKCETLNTKHSFLLYLENNLKCADRKKQNLGGHGDVGDLVRTLATSSRKKNQHRV